MRWFGLGVCTFHCSAHKVPHTSLQAPPVCQLFVGIVTGVWHPIACEIGRAFSGICESVATQSSDLTRDARTQQHQRPLTLASHSLKALCVCDRSSSARIGNGRFDTRGHKLLLLSLSVSYVGGFVTL
eukprot:3167041-Amphidinium_carterae.1